MRSDMHLNNIIIDWYKVSFRRAHFENTSVICIGGVIIEIHTCAPIAKYFNFQAVFIWTVCYYADYNVCHTCQGKVKIFKVLMIQ